MARDRKAKCAIMRAWWRLALDWPPRMGRSAGSALPHRERNRRGWGRVQIRLYNGGRLVVWCVFSRLTKSVQVRELQFGGPTDATDGPQKADGADREQTQEVAEAHLLLGRGQELIPATKALDAHPGRSFRLGQVLGVFHKNGQVLHDGALL